MHNIVIDADLLLREPKDQVVSLGQNADTLSSDVCWRVTGDLEFSSDHPDPSSAAHYSVTDSRDHRYGNTTLTMFTSEQVNSIGLLATIILLFASTMHPGQLTYLPVRVRKIEPIINSCTTLFKFEF